MDEKLAAKFEEQKSKTARRIGKLFGREKKGTNDGDVEAFLQDPSDKLFMTGSEPNALPILSKIDIVSASRWPAAEETNAVEEAPPGHASLKRSKKGLVVRFSDGEPEVIGEGGDEAALPPLQISVTRKQGPSQPTHAVSTLQPEIGNAPDGTTHNVGPTGSRLSRDPSPMPRTEDDIDLIPEIRAKGLERDSTNPNSFTVQLQAKMRAGEGSALLKGFRPPSPTEINVPSDDAPAKIAVFSDFPVEINTSTETQKSVPSRPQELPPRPSPPHLVKPTVILKPVKSPVLESHLAALNIGSDILDDFSDRVCHLFKLFHLSAESVKPLTASSFLDLAGAASWWFLKGKTNLEDAISTRRSYGAGFDKIEVLRQQGHADLAKSLWIVKDIIPNRAELRGCKLEESADLIIAARNAGDFRIATAIEHCQQLLANLRKIAMSMKRNDFLPPKAEDATLPQGLDMSIWVQYPLLPQDVQNLVAMSERLLPTTAKQSSMSISEILPLGDTTHFFHYAQMFVNVSFTCQGMQSLRGPYPCILSVQRPRTEKNLEIVVASQNDLIRLLIRANNPNGPSWNDVRWQSRTSTLEVKLPRSTAALVQCFPVDFQSLGDMCDHAAKIHANLNPRRDEELILEKSLKIFQYFDRSSHSTSFPNGPVPDCLVRIFENIETNDASINAKYKRCAARLAVITAPGVKMLSGTTHDFVAHQPIQYSFMRGEGGDPALLLKFIYETRKSTMVLTFNNDQDRLHFYDYISGGLRDGETTILHAPLKGFFILDKSAPASHLGPNLFNPFQWQSITVINKAREPSQENKKTGLARYLRILTEARNGRINDQINTEPGNVKVKLNSKPSEYELSILIKRQRDLTIAIAEAQVPKEMANDMHHLLSRTPRIDMARVYLFPSLQHLHAFQLALTGFKVVYDNISDLFAISRRRAAVQGAKKLEAFQTRVQIVTHATEVRLVAVFGEDFSHGQCMNFALKTSNVFESFNKSGKYFLRITDANFALPVRSDEGIESGFVCLEMPESPTEQDDIVIGFNTASERDKFSQALPAPARPVSRLGNLMK